MKIAIRKARELSKRRRKLAEDYEMHDSRYIFLGYWERADWVYFYLNRGIAHTSGICPFTIMCLHDTTIDMITDAGSYVAYQISYHDVHK